jgi:hypothetical protein
VFRRYFNPKGQFRQAVWGGAASLGAVTRTKPSSTLFISSMPTSVDFADVEKLFAAHPGFVRFRTVRRMAFCDFLTEFHSISTMRALQGVLVSGHALVIDFDKDPDAKKVHAVECQHADEELRRQLATADAYFCQCCSACCLHLSKAVRLNSLPTRGTDGSSVVDEATQLRRLSVVRAPAKLIKREKGIERQFPLHCPACDVPIGYRPVPLDQPSRFLYIYYGSLKADKRAIVNFDTLLTKGPPVSTTTRTSTDVSVLPLIELRTTEPIAILPLASDTVGESVLALTSECTPPALVGLKRVRDDRSHT